MTAPLPPAHVIKVRTRKARLRRKLENVGHRIDGTFKASKVGKYNTRGGRAAGGKWFHSKAEAARYDQLLEMQEKGMIGEIECQPPFPCYVNGKLVTTYRADFRYLIRPGKFGAHRVIEDVKGVVTDIYNLKRKLVLALHPIEIVDVHVRRIDMAIYRFMTADEIKNLPAPAKGAKHGTRPNSNRKKIPRAERDGLDPPNGGRLPDP